MGNQVEKYKFDNKQWKLISSPHNQILLYESINNQHVHIQQHHILHQNKQQFNHEKQLFQRRLNHSKIVSSVYFQEKQCLQSQFCVYNYQAVVYLERIPIRLCDLKNVAFPYVLHLYNQTLQGYYQLSKIIGCFPVESDYIGINQSGVCKIWAGSKWSEVTVKGNTTSEQDMVKSIIECIQEYVDKNTMPQENPSVRNFVYRRQDRLNFQTAINQLINYINITNNGLVPIKLINIEEVPSKTTTRLNTQLIYHENIRPSIQYITLMNSGYQTSDKQYSDNQGFNNVISPRFTMRTIEKQDSSPLATFKQFQNYQQIGVNRRKSHFYNQSQFRHQNIGHQLQENRILQSIYHDQHKWLQTRPETGRIEGFKIKIPSTFELKSQRRGLNMPSQDNSSCKQLVTNTSNNNLTRNQSNHPFPPQNINNIINSLYQPISSHRPTITSSYNPTNYIYSHREGNQPNILLHQNINRQQQFNRKPIYSHYIHNKDQTISDKPLLRQRPRFMSSKEDALDLNGGQSIIMKLYNQNADNVNMSIPINQQPPQQRFKFLKHSQSMSIYQQIPKPFQTKTIINESQANSIKGIPENVQASSWSNSKNEENYSYFKPFQYSNIDNYSNNKLQKTRQQSIFSQMHPNSSLNNNFYIDQDDGKTPLQFYRQFNLFNKQGFIEESLKSTPKIKNEKKVGFQLQNQKIDEITTIGKFGRSAQSKQNDIQFQLTKKQLQS